MNNTASISHAISALLSPEAGTSEPLTDADNKFIAEYAKAINGPSAQVLAFKNVIQKQGACGFANSGDKDYLLNTDTGAIYNVTVRTNWTQGIEDGEYDEVLESQAGAKIFLGCSQSSFAPVVYYYRSVVGESKI